MNYIYDTTERLKKRFMTSDPFDIANGLGIYVSFRPLGKLKGFYQIVNRERHIVINSSLNNRERIVVCAHELGHDRLHQTFAKVAALKDYLIYDVASNNEYEANLFAADLLMEDGQITELQNDYDFIAMSRIIGVNPNLITFKLMSMMHRGSRFNLPDYDSSFLAK